MKTDYYFFTPAELMRGGCYELGLCLATAEKRMKNYGINFDDIEYLAAEHLGKQPESHRWGSDTDRKYRARLVRQVVAYVAANPKQFTGGEV